MDVILVINKNAYLINYRTLPDSFDKLLPAVDQVIDHSDLEGNIVN
jgi:hypothetical protein